MITFFSYLQEIKTFSSLVSQYDQLFDDRHDWIDLPMVIELSNPMRYKKWYWTYLFELVFFAMVIMIETWYTTKERNKNKTKFNGPWWNVKRLIFFCSLFCIVFLYCFLFFVLCSLFSEAMDGCFFRLWHPPTIYTYVHLDIIWFDCTYAYFIQRNMDGVKNYVLVRTIANYAIKNNYWYLWRFFYYRIAFGKICRNDINLNVIF